MKVLIRVNEDDIKNGRKADRYSCPIAKSLQRSIGVNWGVSTKKLERTPTETTILPKEAITFINRFDHGCGVAPQTFELDIPDNWLI